MSPAALLCELDPVFVPLVARVGPYTLQLRADSPYEALVCAVAGQQLHDRAVAAILGRFRALFAGPAFPHPEAVLAADPEALRGCGFSAAKQASIRALAAAALDGTIPTRAQAEALDDATLIAQLTTLRGVGRWTVEMLLIFTLGRPDVLPVDDFAVREGWRLLTGASVQIKPRALAAIGTRWSPCRTTAAWYLWRAADAAKPRQQPLLATDAG